MTDPLAPTTALAGSGAAPARATAAEARVVLDDVAIRRALVRIAHEVVERNKGIADLGIIGIRSRGDRLALRLQSEIRKLEGDVEAARAVGASPLRVALRHMIPNLVSPVVVMATLNFSNLILLESSLSFLGIGVQPPTATLGSMVGQGRDYMASAPWVVAAPAALIVLVALAAMLLGDHLRDRADARLRER